MDKKRCGKYTQLNISYKKELHFVICSNMDLEGIMLSEISRRNIVWYHLSNTVWYHLYMELKKCDELVILPKKEADSQI